MRCRSSVRTGRSAALKTGLFACPGASAVMTYKFTGSFQPGRGDTCTLRAIPPDTAPSARFAPRSSAAPFSAEIARAHEASQLGRRSTSSMGMAPRVAIGTGSSQPSAGAVGGSAFPCTTSSRNTPAADEAASSRSWFSTHRTAPSTCARTSSGLKGGSQRSLTAIAIGRISSTPSPCRAGCRLTEKMYGRRPGLRIGSSGATMRGPALPLRLAIRRSSSYRSTSSSRSGASVSRKRYTCPLSWREPAPIRTPSPDQEMPLSAISTLPGATACGSLQVHVLSASRDHDQARRQLDSVVRLEFLALSVELDQDEVVRLRRNHPVTGSQAAPVQRGAVALVREFERGALPVLRLLRIRAEPRGERDPKPVTPVDGTTGLEKRVRAPIVLAATVSLGTAARRGCHPRPRAPAPPTSERRRRSRASRCRSRARCRPGERSRSCLRRPGPPCRTGGRASSGRG